MKSKIILATFSTAVLLFSSACSNNKTENTSSQTAVSQKQSATQNSNSQQASIESETEKKFKAKLTAFVEENIEYAESEDLQGYLSTLSSKYQKNPNTISTLKTLFANSTIDYTLVDLKIVSVSKNQVKVQVTQDTVYKDIKNGLDASNSRLTLIHTIIKENGKYKISGTTVLESKKLL